eukprot:128719_1
MASWVVIQALDDLLLLLTRNIKRIVQPNELSIQIFDKHAPNELRQLDSKIKLTVIGFVKRVQNILNQIIPTTIIYICVKYYGFSECFEIAGTPIAISKNHLTIKKLKLKRSSDNAIVYGKDNVNWRCQSAFGERSIKSYDNISIYQWTFKINHGGYGVFVIGFASNYNKNDLTKAFYDKQNNFGFNIYNGRKVTNNKFCNYGDRCGTNDIVTMEVNFKDKTIIYFINGQSQGTAFENIKKDKYVNYKVAVTLQEPNDGCSLISFEKF